MHLNIRDLASHSGQVRHSEDSDVGHLFQGESDVTRAEPLHIEVQAMTDSGVVDVSGTLTLPVEFVCSRCLCHYGQRLSIPFRERFTRDKNHSDTDEDDLHVINEDVVDMTPYIEESVLLGLPYIPVCTPECKGLNPETGANLNIDPAALPEPRIDPRLAVLQQLLDKGKE
jgi:uncharacterized protein